MNRYRIAVARLCPASPIVRWCWEKGLQRAPDARVQHETLQEPGNFLCADLETTTEFVLCCALRLDCVAAMSGLSSEAYLGKGRAALLDIAKSQWGRLRRGGIEAFEFSAAPRHWLTVWHQGSDFGGDCAMDVIGALARQGLEPIHSRHPHAVVLSPDAATERRVYTCLRQRRQHRPEQRQQNRNGNPTPHDHWESSIVRNPNVADKQTTNALS